jgi:hypothetical protein
MRFSNQAEITRLSAITSTPEQRKLRAKLNKGSKGDGARDERYTSHTLFLRDFARTDKLFALACETAKIPTTPRQASKYLRGFGLAHAHLGDALKLMREHVAVA